MPDTALSSKQARFVAEFLLDSNGSRAAVAAGYAEAGAAVAAHRLLRNHKVQEALQARQNADATRLSLRREDALQGLLEAIQQAKAQANPAAMISGWRELGRLLGYYEPQRHQVELSTAADAEMGRYERLTDNELLRLVASG